MRNVAEYVVDGVRWPSVTECLQLAGVVDLSAVPEHVLETARQRGHDVHEWLETCDLGLLPPEVEPDARVEPYVRAYRAFLADTGFVPERIEETVRNDAYRYVGRLDRAGMLNGKPAIVDIKTGAVIGPEVGLQQAGYALALGGTHARYAVQLRDDGTYKLHAFTSREDAHDFLACVRVAHFKLRHGVVSLEELR